MIAIDVLRCTGCGVCVELCPTGALYLVDGKAAVDPALCRECEACLAACPREAITLATHEVPAPEPSRVPAVRPEPALIRVPTLPASSRSGTPAPPPALRARVLPALGTVLAWTGREIVPRLAGIFLDRLDRPASATRQTGNAAGPRGSGGRREGRGGGHRRRERRGGRSG